MLPLKDKRILITRAPHQASDLADQLQALGAIPILIPTIEIVPPSTYAPLDAAIAHLSSFDWLLFTSANAVEVFHKRLQQPQNQVPQVRTLGLGFLSRDGESDEILPLSSARPKIAVIGPATAKAVQGINLPVDLIPPQYIAESLAEALLPDAPGKSFLLIRAAEARDLLPEALTAAGATVTIAEAYRTQTPPESIQALRQLFSTPTTHPDVITFTSASTARNLASLLESANLTLPPAILRASIGPITSQTLRDLGLPPHLEASEPTISALINAIKNHISTTKKPVKPPQGGGGTPKAGNKTGWAASH